ncbi:DUF748 domain-containing protein [Marinomonas profundimaris]|uniref:OmpA-like domain-containing protein n=1 Tax=Marinomonas profundimaris TaxID=1208321 RepID=W1S052_9GAMM|nr:DUF748 domain-containing protein [Marinomonas profundimaris]ETI62597.1 hypothetical protein D104_00990 [Marinomonas profundimaris]
MTRRHFRHFVFYPFAIITALITALWLAAPFVAKHYLSEYFLEQGQDASIEKFSIDFFPPKIDLKNLTINDQSQDTLTLKRAVVEMEIWPLFTKTIHITQARIEGLALQIVQQEKDWIVAGINTTQYLTENEEPTTEAPAASNDTANVNAPWNIKLPSFSVTNSQVNLSRQQDAAIPATQDTFTLSSFTVKGLSGQALTWKGNVALSAMVNQAALTVNSRVNYTPEHAKATISVTDTHLPIDSFRHFLPDPFQDSKGEFSLAGSVDLDFKQNEGAPKITLTKLNIESQATDLDVNINEKDRVSTTSTTLKLTQSTIDFISADQLSLTGELALQSEQSRFTQADQVMQFGHLALTTPFDVQKNELGLTAKSDSTQMDMSDLSIALDSLGVENQQIQVSLTDVAFMMDPQHALTVSLSTEIQSSNLSVLQAGNTAHYDIFNLANTLSMHKNGADISASNTALDINIEGLKAKQIDGKQFSLGSATVTAEQLDFDQEGQQPAIVKGVNLNVFSQLLDSLLTDKKRIASWKSADISHLSFTQQEQNFDVTLGTLNIAELIFSQALADSTDTQKQPPLSQIGLITINKLDANQDGASIHSITTDSLNVSLIIDNQKRIENLVFINEDQKDNPDTPLSSASAPKAKDVENTINEQDPAFKAPYYVILDAYDVTGASSVNVQDKSISPALQRRLEIETLSIRNINTLNKDQATVLALKARSGKYATLQSDLTIWPLADRLTMKSELIIKEAELPPYSSYIANVLGYQIDSGQLDLDLKLHSDNGVLDGNSHILLREFDLGGRKDSSTAIKAGAVPLNIAVSILKDSDNNIDLEIPLSGDIDNPEFGWKSFLLLPVKKALYTASSNYLMQTFVPYANVISIAQFAGDQLLKIRVEPLLFDPEDGQLNASQAIFLKQLVALMKDKKDSQLKACGVASYVDLGFEKSPASIDNATAEIATALGQERAEALKDYLVNEGISSSRIYLCSPEIDLSKSSKARVELNF